MRLQCRHALCDAAQGPPRTVGGRAPPVQAPEDPEQRHGPRVPGTPRQARRDRDFRSRGRRDGRRLHGPVQPRDGRDHLARAADRRVQVDLVRRRIAAAGLKSITKGATQRGHGTKRPATSGPSSGIGCREESENGGGEEHNDDKRGHEPPWSPTPRIGRASLRVGTKKTRKESSVGGEYHWECEVEVDRCDHQGDAPKEAGDEDPNRELPLEDGEDQKSEFKNGEYQTRQHQTVGLREIRVMSDAVRVVVLARPLDTHAPEIISLRYIPRAAIVEVPPRKRGDDEHETKWLGSRTPVQ